MDPDRKFVSDAAAGNREAFDELVRRYRRRVYNLVRPLTGGHCDAEDLVQEIFLRAYRAIGAFRGDSTFQSWLYRISVNAVHSHHSRRRSQRLDDTVPLEDAADVEELTVQNSLEEALVRRQAIDRALATLPPNLRTLVVLRDAHGLRSEEIARIVRIPRGTVDSRLFRARQRLRPLLEHLVGRAPADVERPPVPTGSIPGETPETEDGE